MTTEEINRILFVSMLIGPSLIILGAVVYLASRVMPVLLRQMQQLVDNNTQFAKIARDNAAGLGGVKLAIELQTNEIKAQGFDFKSYQTLVRDGMEDHSHQIEANTEKIEAHTIAISVLKTSLETMPALIVAAIKDEIKCGTLLSEFQSLRSEVTRAVFQQQARETGSMRQVVIPVTTPATLPPASSAAPDEKKT